MVTQLCHRIDALHLLQQQQQQQTQQQHQLHNTSNASDEICTPQRLAAICALLQQSFAAGDASPSLMSSLSSSPPLTASGSHALLSSPSLTSPLDDELRANLARLICAPLLSIAVYYSSRTKQQNTSIYIYIYILLVIIVFVVRSKRNGSCGSIVTVAREN